MTSIIGAYPSFMHEKNWIKVSAGDQEAFRKPALRLLWISCDHFVADYVVTRC